MSEYAHDAHCNTVHEAGPSECPPPRELDTAIVRPGDTLIVRIDRGDGMSREVFEQFSKHLQGRLPDVQVLVVCADQILVFRPDAEG